MPEAQFQLQPAIWVWVSFIYLYIYFLVHLTHACEGTWPVIKGKRLRKTLIHQQTLTVHFGSCHLGFLLLLSLLLAGFWAVEPARVQ